MLGPLHSIVTALEPGEELAEQSMMKNQKGREKAKLTEIVAVLLVPLVREGGSVRRAATGGRGLINDSVGWRFYCGACQKYESPMSYSNARLVHLAYKLDYNGEYEYPKCPSNYRYVRTAT